MRPDKRKTVEKRDQKELRAEVNHTPIVVPAAAKYKKNAHERKNQPDIFVGKQGLIAVERYAYEREGYYLAEVVDWVELHDMGFWTYRTEVIFRVIDCSNTKIPYLTGRLVVAGLRGSAWSGHMTVMSWNPEDFHKV